MIKFSVSALKAVPKFFSYRNDVDIFTEDKVADKEFYKTLFAKLFGETIKINDVTPLGCKTNVLNAYDNQNLNDKRRKYYIVDGDLDLITETNRKNENNLIILDAYCIENYLIDEIGAIELLYFSNGSESRDNLKNKLNFDKWLGYNSTVLINLFLNFAILKKYGGGPKLRNANEFLKIESKQTILDKDKILGYTSEIKERIIDYFKSENYPDPDKLYNFELQQLSEKWADEKVNLLKIVSAKNYLLPLFQFRINHCINKGKALIPKESFKLFLANHSSMERLEFLKQRIK